MRSLGWSVVGLCALSVACGDRPVDSAGAGEFGGAGGAFNEAGEELPPLVDDRPPIVAETPPPPISGGTLAITRDGAAVVAADPDRDRVSIVDLRARSLMHTIALAPGSEPGRVHQDAAGRVHVLLRRAASIATLDIGQGTIDSERAVCSMPRGIDDDPATDMLYVACAGGEIVALPGGEGEASEWVDAGPDLRDVVLQDDALFVARFRSAGILRVPLSNETWIERPLPDINHTTPGDPGQTAAFEPSGAWRMLDAGDGSVLVLHQYAFAGPIELEPEDGTAQDESAEHSDLVGESVTPYGGSGLPCDSIVRSALSEIGSDGQARPGIPIDGGVLPVDAAVSADAKWVAVVHAGGRDPDAPTRIGRHAARVTLASRDDFAGVGAASDSRCLPSNPDQVPGQPTAVAFNPAMDPESASYGPWYIVQSREPAMLSFFDSVFDEPTLVDLGGESVADTGHDLFHRDAGAGIACASCHLEGGDDARVWRFEPIGPRRTQSLHVGLQGTEPFHWDGDMSDLGMLMSEVFVSRMGGAEQSPERRHVLARWLFSLEAPTPLRAADDPAAVRGAALFHSDTVGCASCHAGATFTSPASQYVGTTADGHALQVPSLVGVAHRAPFIHDGCAETLAARFDPPCGGGDAHGKTSGLGDGEIADLIAYLESL